MPDLPVLLFGSATDPVKITHAEHLRMQAARIFPKAARLTDGVKATVTIENVSTGSFFDGVGFTSASPTVLEMKSLGFEHDHFAGLYEYILPATPAGASIGDLIEAHLRAGELVRAIRRIRYVAPSDQPLAGRRFPRRRHIPFTAVPSTKTK